MTLPCNSFKFVLNRAGLHSLGASPIAFTGKGLAHMILVYLAGAIGAIFVICWAISKVFGEAFDIQMDDPYDQGGE